MTGADFVALSLVPMVVAVLAALACAVPGTFLVLRGQAMLGDMMAHAVLPGIVAGFLLTGRATGLAMVLGAVAAALASVAMVEAIGRLGRIGPAAAMAMTFTTLFAGGVLLLELSGAAGVHLDVEHALYGTLESLLWLEAGGWGALADPVAIAALPVELWQVAAALALVGAGAAVFWRPLVMASFDAGHAAGLGLPVRALSLGLVAATALASVAAFATVGSILTIAMLIVPAATARLLTDRIAVQMALALALAAGAAVAGYVLAGWGPVWVGLPGSVSAAGMIAVVSGAGLAMAAAASRRGRARG